MASRIDVSIEDRRARDDGERAGPNTCPRCHSHYRDDELEATLRVCPQCGHHFPVRARERIRQLADEGTFEEEAADLRSEDPLDFFDLRPYTERLVEAEQETRQGDAMVIGSAAVERISCELAVMDFAFMGGSMGSVVGEKFCRACESATERGVPLVSVTASGGARMQEGILSLMQMAKVSAALARYDSAGGLYVSILTNPTMGGVAASFALQGDITLAEPGALIGFAGKRTIWNTVRLELPEGFQTSEFLLKHGFIDRIVPRKDLRTEVARIIDYCEH